MAPITLLPDAEQLVVQFLLAQPEVLAFFPEAPHDRVYSILPTDSVAWPLVRVTRFGGAPVTSPRQRLDRASLQIEAFGGAKKIAHNLARTCQAVLADRLPGAHTAGFVTGVQFGAFADVPDSDFEPARMRWLFACDVYTHP